METTDLHKRDFSTISPSARALLLLKGLTDIPYARKAAKLMMHPDKYEPDFGNKNFGFWTRVVHFEYRYSSVNQLLSALPVKNVLELSSGFSFRGLDMVRQKKVHYIDTDLPEVIEKKNQFVAALRDDPNEDKGQLELLPLNALDEKQFKETISHFEPGEIAIVNEGLLVYLNTEEKIKLCSIIRDVLKQRGGYWITADIYIRLKPLNDILKVNDELQEFFDEHHIEENKFESIEAAEDFFKSAGFMIEKEAIPDYASMSTLSYMLKATTQEQLAEMGKSGKIHATWCLRVVGD